MKLSFNYLLFNSLWKEIIYYLYNIDTKGENEIV